MVFSKELAKELLGSYFDGRRVVYVALMRKTKTGVEELRGGGYRRVPFSDFTWDDREGAMVNASKIAFPTATSDWEVRFVAMFDAEDEGNLLLVYPLKGKAKVRAGETLVFLPGDFRISVI